jgi:hypothetical protein
MKTDTLKTDTFSTSKTLTPTQPTTPPAVPSSTASRAPSPTPSDHNNSPKEEFLPMKCIRTLSQRVHDILEGHGATSARPSDSVITTGVRVPPIVEEVPTQVLEGEGSADWMMIANLANE